MPEILSMDLHRMKHSIVTWVCVAFITAMAVGLVLSGMGTSLGSMLGSASVQSTADDAFMTSTLGAGVIHILVSIILSAFVCGDYTRGFAKNIFTTHSRPKDYVIGKMASMGILSAAFLILYAIESALALAILGDGFTLGGTFTGLLVFLVEKWLLGMGLFSIVLLVTLLTRNTAWGIVAGFLVATGGLTMGISMLSGFLHIPWLASVFAFTISATSGLCSLTFDGLFFIRALLVAIGWTAAASALSMRTLTRKDVC